jgi:hypothetical protein
MGDQQIREYTAEILDCGLQLSARLGFATQPVAAH